MTRVYMVRHGRAAAGQPQGAAAQQGQAQGAQRKTGGDHGWYSFSKQLEWDRVEAGIRLSA